MLSVRTNESSPFARLSLTLMVPPMLRRLHRIIKAARVGGGCRTLCVSAFLCMSVCTCFLGSCVCLTKHPLERPPAVCATASPFFSLYAAKVSECNAHERKQKPSSHFHTHTRALTHTRACLCAHIHILGGETLPQADQVKCSRSLLHTTEPQT